MSRLNVSKDRIVEDLTKLGIIDGDTLYVHSSLKSIGFVQGGADTVIEALLEAVGSNGTLVLPAFSVLGSMLETVKSGRTFDPKKTTCTIGRIPETFRTRQGVFRSIHPTHSVCAYGAKAKWITNGHHECKTTFGKGTPYWKMIRLDAKVMGLGVDLAYPTFYHTFENLRDDFPIAVYHGREYEVEVLDGNGKRIKMKVRPHSPKVAKTRIDKSRGEFIRKYITDYLASRNTLRLGLSGEAHCWIISVKELLACLRELMERGITIYTTKDQLPPIGGRKRVHLVRNYQSSHSPKAFDYLLLEAKQAKLAASRKGFWDDRKERWIRCQNWSRSDWRSYVEHDWKYALELQEGATIFEIVTGMGLLENCLVKELDYMLSQINGDGAIPTIPDDYGTSGYEYGLLLSCLALGVKYFRNRKESLAKQCYENMIKVSEYVEKNWAEAEVTEDHSVILRGFVNAWHALNSDKDNSEKELMKRQIENYAAKFLREQNADGSFGDPFSSRPVQTEEKIDIALLLAYPIVGLNQCLVDVKRNVDWILSERWIGKTGALAWSLDHMDLFFECHQLWFMIILRYLKDLSNGTYNYLNYAKNAWLFLTDNNYANIDMFVHNYQHTGAFFSYREVNEKGEIQSSKFGRFKGAYEIGTSLWSLALNYDL